MNRLGSCATQSNGQGPFGHDGPTRIVNQRKTVDLTPFGRCDFQGSNPLGCIFHPDGLSSLRSSCCVGGKMGQRGLVLLERRRTPCFDFLRVHGVSVLQVLASLFHLLALGTPIVVSVEDVRTDVHPVAHDLDRHVVKEVRGYRAGTDVVG